MRKFAVVIPNRYEDVIQPLIWSMKYRIPEYPPIVIVADNHDRCYGFARVDYACPEFSFSKAVNIGINALPGYDIILINDDCQVMNQNFFLEFAKESEKFPYVGILSPLIKGGVGNPLQSWWFMNMHITASNLVYLIPPDQYLCFPCVYLRRDMLNQVGLFNESIERYGQDDADLCKRASSSGWGCAVTTRLMVQHGDGSALVAAGRGKSWSTSFARRCP